MIFNKENLNDIHKYYTDNIVKFKETGDRLWQIKEINSNDILCQDADGFQVYIDLNEDYEVDYPLPTRTVYQCGDKAMMLIRRPQKQYNRGIHNQNTGLLYLHGSGLWQNTGITIQTLQQFVDKPCYQSVENITGDIEVDGKQSFALDKHFSVACNGYLFALNTEIGNVLFKAKKIKAHKLFHKELQNLFKGWEFV